MNELDHLEIRSEDPTADRADEDDTAEIETSGRASGALWFVLAGVMLIAAVVAAWLWWPRDSSSSPAPTDPLAGLETTPSEPVDQELEPDPDLPPLAESDPLVRALISTLSSHPRLAAWLANDALVDRFTRVIANVAFDEDPSSHLPFLRPAGDFATTEGEEGALVVDQAAFARYDLACDAFVSLDTEGSVELYRRLLPLFQASYQELGMPGDFRDALRRAIDKVLATPSVPGELAVRQETLAFRYQDPELEALGPAQKLLLRTGPRNAARVKAKVREIAGAAGLL